MAAAFTSSLHRAPVRQPGITIPVFNALSLGHRTTLRAPAVVRSPARGVVVRAADKGPKRSVDADSLLNDLQEKWDNVDDKTSFGIYAGGALLALWIASSVVGAFNSIPLVPKLFELVGLVYSAWFVYRYLLFKSSREELLRDIDDLKEKITGGDS